MGAKQSANIGNIDISSYLTQEQADEIYQVKPPTDDEFILKTYADDTYKFPEDYVSKNELSAYLLEDKAKRLYQELPPNGDQFVLKSYTDQLNRLTSNYATMTELNKYITQDLASSIYQPKGNYLALDVNNNIRNNGTNYVIKGADAFGNNYFTINNASGVTSWSGQPINFNSFVNFRDGINSYGDIVAINRNNQIITEGDNNFSNSMNFQKKRPGGVKNGNELGYITFEGTDTGNKSRRGAFIYSTAEGDFTPTSNPANIRFLTTPPGTTNPIDRMIIKPDGNIVIPNKGSLVIPDNVGGYGDRSGSYIYNDGQTLKIQMRNEGDGRIELKSGSKTLSFDKDGKLCFAPGRCITENTPGINWSS